jgi:hypothetical protein
MSKYDKLKKRKPKDFKRLIGVKEETFGEMLKVFRDYWNVNPKWYNFLRKMKKTPKIYSSS